MTQPPEGNTSTVLLDSHVHLYHWSDLVPILDSARVCHQEQDTAHHSHNPASAVVLVFTEPRERDTFARLKRQLESESTTPLAPDWQLHSTAEPLSLIATHTDGAEIFLISGQQIVTRERLEVLSIATEQSIADRLPLAATLKAIEDAGGFPILPWGVGKWLFRRGKLVSQLIRENDNPVHAPFALGDNGGRPQFWRWVKQFDLARTHNIPVISGSDPLPCSNRRHVAANFGTLISCCFDRERPAMSLLKAIAERTCDTRPFGALTRSMDFMRDQLALRFNCN
ncbi:hypothetical protein [Desulfosediminicola ganghwensis]|uniref:hypothetical protein n=1 Tax=Desulfosediminicola ganghwensis TaxID=2569540 RepID=UPI0010ABE49E|nr:hypothetical protein [Desulfosediminicola ganghwensis]